jgi:modification methylase
MTCRVSTHRFLSGDARSLSAVSDKSVDLIVTSPPYPMIEMWDGDFRGLDPEIDPESNPEDAHERMHCILDAAWREAHRVLRDGGIACINIGDATRTLSGGFRLFVNHARVIATCNKLGFVSLPLILWRKQTNAPTKFMGSGMYPPGAYVTLEHEYILVFRKGGRRRFGPNAEETRRRRESAYFWEERNVWFSDVWDFKGARQAMGIGRGRSAAFPLELAFRLVSMFSLKGDTVLDPFAGTGTTSIAAAACARDSIAVELDPSLSAAGAERLRASVPEMNALVRRRLEGHAAFVQQRCASGKPLCHANAAHGFPVMTKQEEVMVIESIHHLSSPRDAGIVEISHTVFV